MQDDVSVDSNASSATFGGLKKATRKLLGFVTAKWADKHGKPILSSRKVELPRPVADLIDTAFDALSDVGNGAQAGLSWDAVLGAANKVLGPGTFNVSDLKLLFRALKAGSSSGNAGGGAGKPSHSPQRDGNGKPSLSRVTSRLPSMTAGALSRQPSASPASFSAALASAAGALTSAGGGHVSSDPLMQPLSRDEFTSYMLCKDAVVSAAATAAPLAPGGSMSALYSGPLGKLPSAVREAEGRFMEGSAAGQDLSYVFLAMYRKTQMQCFLEASGRKRLGPGQLPLDFYPTVIQRKHTDGDRADGVLGGADAEGGGYDTFGSVNHDLGARGVSGTGPSRSASAIQRTGLPPQTRYYNVSLNQVEHDDSDDDGGDGDGAYDGLDGLDVRAGESTAAGSFGSEADPGAVVPPGAAPRVPLLAPLQPRPPPQGQAQGQGQGQRSHHAAGGVTDRAPRGGAGSGVLDHDVVRRANSSSHLEPGDNPFQANNTRARALAAPGPSGTIKRASFCLPPAAPGTHTGGMATWSSASPALPPPAHPSASSPSNLISHSHSTSALAIAAERSARSMLSNFPGHRKLAASSSSAAMGRSGPGFWSAAEVGDDYVLPLSPSRDGRDSGASSATPSPPMHQRSGGAGIGAVGSATEEAWQTHSESMSQSNSQSYSYGAAAGGNASHRGAGGGMGSSVGRVVALASSPAVVQSQYGMGAACDDVSPFAAISDGSRSRASRRGSFELSPNAQGAYAAAGGQFKRPSTSCSETASVISSAVYSMNSFAPTSGSGRGGGGRGGGGSAVGSAGTGPGGAKQHRLRKSLTNVAQTAKAIHTARQRERNAAGGGSMTTGGIGSSPHSASHSGMHLREHPMLQAQDYFGTASGTAAVGSFTGTGGGGGGFGAQPDIGLQRKSSTLSTSNLSSSNMPAVDGLIGRLRSLATMSQGGAGQSGSGGSFSKVVPFPLPLAAPSVSSGQQAVQLQLQQLYGFGSASPASSGRSPSPLPSPSPLSDPQGTFYHTQSSPSLVLNSPMQPNTNTVTSPSGISSGGLALPEPRLLPPTQWQPQPHSPACSSPHQAVPTQQQVQQHQQQADTATTMVSTSLSASASTSGNIWPAAAPGGVAAAATGVAALVSGGSFVQSYAGHVRASSGNVDVRDGSYADGGSFAMLPRSGSRPVGAPASMGVPQAPLVHRLGGAPAPGAVGAAAAGAASSMAMGRGANAPAQSYCPPLLGTQQQPVVTSRRNSLSLTVPPAPSSSSPSTPPPPMLSLPSFSSSPPQQPTVSPYGLSLSHGGSSAFNSPGTTTAPLSPTYAAGPAAAGGSPALTVCAQASPLPGGVSRAENAFLAGLGSMAGKAGKDQR